MTPAAFEFCHQCKRETFTAHLALSSGHLARVCADCRTCRKSHPYAAKAKGRKARGRGRHGSR